jgi:hypothetical protein
MMNQNEIKQQIASLTTSRLSPLAKPFTLNNRSSFLSPKPSFNSFNNCDDDDSDDPFSSLLDSFRKMGRSVSLNDNVKTSTLPVGASKSQTNHEISLFEGNPFPELPKNGDFDELHWSHFEVANSAVGDVNMFQKGGIFMVLLKFFCNFYLIHLS